MISSPRTSANNLCDLFAEVRGLDILYFCCCCCCSLSFYVFLYVYFCCFYVLALSFLSFCIYNRKNTYKNINNKNNSKENIKHRNLPARPLDIFIFRGGSWAGYPVFLFVFTFFLEFFCLFSVSVCFCVVFA